MGLMQEFGRLAFRVAALLPCGDRVRLQLISPCLAVHHSSVSHAVVVIHITSRCLLSLLLSFPLHPVLLQALDLLDKMLMFNPAKRITVEEALEHPYMESLHSPEDEPVCDKPFDFGFESETMDKPTLQRLMYQEVCCAVAGTLVLSQHDDAASALILRVVRACRSRSCTRRSSLASNCTRI